MRSGARLKITLIRPTPRSSPAPPGSRQRALDRVVAPGVLVGVEPLQRAPERVLDRQLRSPAEAADALGVEADQRAVADPAAPPAGVLDRGRDRQVPGDEDRK